MSDYLSAPLRLSICRRPSVCLTICRRPSVCLTICRRPSVCLSVGALRLSDYLSAPLRSKIWRDFVYRLKNDPYRKPKLYARQEPIFSAIGGYFFFQFSVRRPLSVGLWVLPGWTKKNIWLQHTRGSKRSICKSFYSIIVYLLSLRITVISYYSPAAFLQRVADSRRKRWGRKWQSVRLSITILIWRLPVRNSRNLHKERTFFIKETSGFWMKSRTCF